MRQHGALHQREAGRALVAVRVGAGVCVGGGGGGTERSRTRTSHTLVTWTRATICARAYVDTSIARKGDRALFAI